MSDLLVCGAVLPLTSSVDGRGRPRPGGPRGQSPTAAGGADAVAVRGGRIAAVGSVGDLERLVPGARRLDLRGRAVIPGFNDAHVHIWKMGHLLTSMVDMRRVDSLPALQQALRDAFARPGWMVGRGWNEARMREGRSPTRHDLDAAVGDRPVLLTRTCGHIAVASSRAMAMAHVTATTPDPPGGVVVRDAQGEPTGELHETAMGLVADLIPPLSSAEYEETIRAGAIHQVSLGITSATEAGVPPEILRVYVGMRDRLPYRVNVMALRLPLTGGGLCPLPDRHLSDRLRVDSVKVLADGGLSGATAAMREPYRRCAPDLRSGCEGCGVLRLDADQMLSMCADAHRLGLRIGVHAIGDRAIDEVLDAYERLGPGPVRHRLEHFGLPHPEQIERAARLDLIAVPQAIFLSALGGNFRHYLSDRMLARAYPIREMQAALTVALSSDAPVVSDDNPLLGIQAAVLRSDEDGPIAPEQAISVEEALRAYTLGGAIASGDEDNRGTLVPGKWADMAVLSADPLGVPAERLHEIRVDMTIIGGEIVYER